ncbi:MAG: 16S rRNA (cytosine(967)-C(5))-methyltransferase RsmB, partial [Mogibacterium sp.]|nr:16S rRNA (cytosine(967)-C(5))-methyltransferase RsmB [Mogibacterium sp.]
REEYINSFDYVLADVPCSGLGVVGSKPELKLRTEPSEYKELIKTQNEILDNAYQYVRKGGRIMYSTCTVNKDENDGVIEAFLERHRFATVVEKSLILPYNKNLVGFYYCIIEKQ